MTRFLRIAAQDPRGRRPPERINPLAAASRDIGAFAATFPRVASDRLNEPHTPSPLVLAQEHAAELREPRRRIVEGAKDALAIVDGEREHLRLGVVALLELLRYRLEGDLSEQTRELEDVFVGYRNPCQHHRSEATAQLLPFRLHPDVEVDPLAVEDDLAFADLGSHDDPVIEYHVSLERNLTCELNSRGPVREVESRVVSGSHQEGSISRVRHQ